MSQESMAAPLTRKVHSTQTKKEALMELQKAVKGNRQVIAAATTAFPFTIFPSTLTVDRTQVSITQRKFFLVGETTVVRLDDILNVTAQVGPMLGTVRISTRFFDPEKPHIVRPFWREDALRIAAILNGLVIATAREIDITALDDPELADTLMQLGQNPRDAEP